MPFRVLCVCTGNICRSPTAERILTDRLTSLGAAGAFDVTSAGSGALVGEPIQPYAEALLVEAGVDTSSFAARQLSEPMLAGADLILGMTRDHRAVCATLSPKTLPRLFTLREFARLATAAAADGVEPGSVDPESWARQLVAAAASRRGLVRPDRPSDDDVGDPYGGPASGYVEPFELISEACVTVAGLLARPLSTR